jgi:hypothetical protein
VSMTKLENPSDKHRNTPVDEYSESSHYIDTEPSGVSGNHTDRNHYFAKIDISHEEFTRSKVKSKLQKYTSSGRKPMR